MQGTEWTEPGQGATVRELLELRPLRYDGPNSGRPIDGILAAYRLERLGLNTRTNLRLTGEPLTADDLKRIAECK